MPATLSPSESLLRVARAWRGDRRRVLHRADPEDIHRLRTATRRLTVAVSIAKSDLHLTEPVALDAWKHLDRSLSRLRDLDVLCETLAEAQGGIPRPAAHAVDREIERIERKRRRARRQAIDALDRRSVARVVAALVAAVERAPPRLPPGSATAAAARWWRREGTRLAKAGGWAITIERSQAARSALHRIRRNARALRYGLEWWESIGAAIMPAPVEVTRRLQTVLGRIRDLDRALDAMTAPKSAAAAAYLRSERRTAVEAWRALAARRPILTRSPSRAEVSSS